MHRLSLKVKGFFFLTNYSKEKSQAHSPHLKRETVRKMQFYFIWQFFSLEESIRKGCKAILFCALVLFCSENYTEKSFFFRVLYFLFCSFIYFSALSCCMLMLMRMIRRQEEWQQWSDNIFFLLKWKCFSHIYYAHEVPS